MSKVKVTGPQSAKISGEGDRVHGRREFALYRVPLSSYNVYFQKHTDA